MANRSTKDLKYGGEFQEPFKQEKPFELLELFKLLELLEPFKPIEQFELFLLYEPGVFIMYIIAVYDVGQKRCGKMLKLCRGYLHHIQNSVLEGEITEAKLEELKIKAKKIMDEDEEDSLIIFKSRNEKWLDKEIVGKEKRPVDNVL